MEPACITCSLSLEVHPRDSPTLSVVNKYPPNPLYWKKSDHCLVACRKDPYSEHLSIVIERNKPVMSLNFGLILTLVPQKYTRTNGSPENVELCVFMYVYVYVYYIYMYGIRSKSAHCRDDRSRAKDACSSQIHVDDLRCLCCTCSGLTTC